MRCSVAFAAAVAGADVTLYKVSGSECGQATLDAKYETEAVKFAGLSEGTCSGQGFTVADGSKTMSVPVLGDITVSLFKKAMGAGSSVTLYKASGSECGQATLDAKYEAEAVKFAGLSEGTCSGQGFTVADGTKTMSVPVLGDITVSLFKKAMEAGSSVTLYKVSGAECGQATLDAKYETEAVKFAGLSEGTCSGQGFTVADGSKTMSVPVLGDITVSLFKKGAMKAAVDLLKKTATQFLV